MIVDIHTHFFPLELIQNARIGKAFDGITILEKTGQEYICHQQGSRYPLRKEFHDLKAKLEMMDQLGIDKSILSIAPTLFMYWVDNRETERISGWLNDLLAEFISTSSERLLGMATIPMQDPEMAVKELRRAILELKLCGAQIGTSVGSVPLDDPRFSLFFDEVTNLDIPLLLHPYVVGKRERMEEHQLNNLVGNPLDTELAAARLIFSGFLDRFPNLKIIFAHGGGFLPYQIGRFNHQYSLMPIESRPKNAPGEYLKNFFYDTVLFDPRPLEFLISMVGAERIMVGTDSPFAAQDLNFQNNIESLRLDETNKMKIYNSTACGLFKISDASH